MSAGRGRPLLAAALAALAAVAAAALLAAAAGLCTACPRCRRWWSVWPSERSPASTERVTEGGRTVVRTTYAWAEECRRCGASWCRFEVEERAEGD